MSRWRTLLLALAAGWLIAAGPLVEGFGLPLPQGFEEVPDARRETATPEGPIVETLLAGRQDPFTVQVELSAAADALGWLPLGPPAPGDPQRFVRGRERLSIMVERRRQWTVITLMLEPIG